MQPPNDTPLDVFIGRLVSCISQDFDELAVFVDLFTHTVEHAHLLQFLAQVLDCCIK